MKQKILFERGGIGHIEKLLFELDIARPLIVSGGKSYEICGAKEKINALAIDTSGQFSVSTSLPELDEVERGLARYKTGDFDAVIAVGGGTVMDTAKLIRFCKTQNIAPAQAIQNIFRPSKKDVPLIAIPTTAGSGAEATHFAVLYINGEKYSAAHPNILADIALVDPELSFSVPKSLAASSGMDALCQGIESFWSVNATEESRQFSRQAIQLASMSLIPAVCDNEKNAMEHMSHAALFAGQAINISKTTAPHAVSYILTSKFGVQHGHAVSLTLGGFLLHASRATVNTANSSRSPAAIQGDINELCNLLGVTTPGEANNYLQELMKSLNLPTRLSALKIFRTDFETIVQSVNLERLQNHPCKVDEQDIYDILNSIA